MGAWGYEPAENDSSHDLVIEADHLLEKHLVSLFKRKLKDRSATRQFWARWSRVGLAQILSERYGIFVPVPVAEQCVVDLELLLEDDQFMDHWRDPAEARAKIRAMLRELKKNLKLRATHAGKEFGRVYVPLFGYKTAYMNRLVEAGVVRKLGVRRVSRPKSKPKPRRRRSSSQK